MNVLRLPLSPQPQLFSITLGQQTYNVVLKWNPVANCWVLDFSDENSDPIVQGIPLVTGADLLEQFGYLNFGGKLIAQTDNNVSQPPNFNDLGTDANVYFVTP